MLPAAIGSCLSQVTDAVDVEVVVVDDGSTDDTRAVLATAGYDRAVVCHFLAVNCGRNVARNEGLAIATGDFVKFLDSDDRLCAGSLVKEVDLAVSAAADVVLTGTQVATYQDDGTLIIDAEKQLDAPLMEPLLDSLLAGKAVPTSSALYRRKYVNAIRWDESLSKLDDWDWFIRACMLGGKIVTAGHCSYCWCQHDGQGIRNTSMLQNAKEHHAILDKLGDVLRERDELTSCRARRLAEYYYKELRVLCLHEPTLFLEAVLKIKSLAPRFAPVEEECQGWMRWACKLLGFENAVRIHTSIKRRLTQK